MKPIISFPGLGIGTYELQQVVFSVFGIIEVRWSGLAVLLGIVLAIAYGAWCGKRRERIKGGVADVGLIAALFGAVGARVYYVLMTLGTDPYESLSDVLSVRDGGTATCGALVGGTIGIVIWCLVKRLPCRRWLDVAAVSATLAQAIGAWSGFFTAEAHGSAIGTRTVFELFGLRIRLPSGKGTLFYMLRMGLEKYGTFAYYHPVFFV